MKRLREISFEKVLVAVGLLLVLIVAGDLTWRGLHRFPVDPVWPMPDADPRLGRQAIIAHGCGACHVIPGVRGATGRVGPQLVGLEDQMYIAGVIANTPHNLAAWIQDPPAINPLTAMPKVGVTEAEAWNMAAYLYSAGRGRTWRPAPPPEYAGEAQ